MDFVKKNWAQVRSYLEDMTFAQKWLIAALMVILLMVGGIAMLYVGNADKVPITQFAAGRSAEVMATLQSAGIDVEQQGNQLVVPRAQQDDAIALLEDPETEIDPTGKSYKAYLKNPRLEYAAGGFAKIYWYHWTEEQAARWTKRVRELTAAGRELNALERFHRERRERKQ